MELTKEQFDIGEVTLTDVSIAEARLLLAQSELIESEKNVNTLSAKFNYIFGVNPNKPNIILILADDLGFNDVSLYNGGAGDGSLMTPNMDRIGLEGIKFNNGYAASASCSPSRASIMTGRYSTRFGFEFTPAFKSLITITKWGEELNDTGFPIIFDSTHSAQLPGGNGSSTGGMREMIPYLSRAAVAAGCDGIFMEVHDDVEKSKSDSSTQWPLDKLEPLLKKLISIKESIL